MVSGQVDTPVYFENVDLATVISPVNVSRLQQLLLETRYNQQEINFLVEGFTHGFDLGYRGPEKVKRKAPNLKLRVGNQTILWNKVMKEVKNGRYAGPFKEIPFDYYIQSPIGLVPKDSDDTRLIFHLSYLRNGSSVNSETPKHMCSVRYPSFNDAIGRCMEEIQQFAAQELYVGKSDMRSAFRNLGMLIRQIRYLVMKARSPFDGVIYYFVDKCLPFGVSISCTIFQRFSDAVAHIVSTKSGRRTINYLDDYLFVAFLKMLCDQQIKLFLEVCADINFPVSMEKTIWGETWVIFLGLLIDRRRRLICLPKEKILRVQKLIQVILGNKRSKATVHQMQQLCGFFNFLGKSILPGRAFTRRLYAVIGFENTAMKNSGQGARALKKHHHVKLSKENTLDLEAWKFFLHHPTAYCRDFMDFSKIWSAEEIEFFTDSSKNPELGYGGWCQKSWFARCWDAGFIEKCNPSIAYLELYAVTVGILLWINRFKNRRVIIHCDNQAVVNMLNSSSSKCRNCMVLIRLITVESMMQNVRIYAEYVSSKDNAWADALSRIQIRKFRQLSRDKDMEEQRTKIPQVLLPQIELWKN